MNERWIRSFDSDSFKRINNDVKCQKIKLDMIAAHFIISFSSIILANYVVQTIDKTDKKVIDLKRNNALSCHKK